METFKQYHFPEFIEKALEKLGFKTPTHIQKEIIPLVQQGKNVIGQSQTGSGKSHSFLLPLIASVDVSKPDVQVVITSPSRELANQLFNVAKQLVEETDITISNFVGGTDKQRQVAKLNASQPHIVIGTPGRILDLMKEQALKVYKAKTLVIDEADMTLDLGFLPEVDEIASQFPKELQMLVFSATIPQKLKPFLKKYMENPVEVNLQPETIVASTIHNQLLSTKGQNELDILYQILNIGQPYLVMVFVNTKQKAEKVTTTLRERGLKVAMIHGDVPARERKRLMKQIQQLDYQYIVATDLAARGIDIEGVSHVINMDIPKDLDFFIHRVGRTGRNGLSGTAITFYAPDQDQAVQQLEKRGVQFTPVVLKDNELVETFDRNRREKREKIVEKEHDTVIAGMVKKAKQNVKPGYKRKLKTQIEKRERQKRRQQKRK
ncbi:DEAD/DEAH box helicase [Granulicatella sp. zg-ZJ]|uniref:DEAD/DEAH box helicase n=1 Tax=unclassified Granulicatella TaxID=2630493 RepID=UPI0013BF8C2E|nr:MULTISPECIES: DEAD/DEAH box helicase [unclassified Granulicatella]MBS4750510.1 DEAD/DEAH box helicase [Carnobacteriaceae bacterium zg-ZUI78]NEW62547.1 DEAD/DEAH box helicase [Granulicatella sp. zg-ZJ]NEW66095.1 DEAD/DEAH box helicase [Granulicatella sp. zg-84]QMI85464.1 DEAD/DEAH box helicase [Carnobacteriaceae bacterium zg-84]